MAAGGEALVAHAAAGRVAVAREEEEVRVDGEAATGEAAAAPPLKKESMVWRPGAAASLELRCFRFQPASLPRCCCCAAASCSSLLSVESSSCSTELSSS